MSQAQPNAQHGPGNGYYHGYRSLSTKRVPGAERGQVAAVQGIAHFVPAREGIQERMNKPGFVHRPLPFGIQPCQKKLLQIFGLNQKPSGHKPGNRSRGTFWDISHHPPVLATSVRQIHICAIRNQDFHKPAGDKSEGHWRCSFDG